MSASSRRSTDRRSQDAYWVATSGTTASWVFVLHIQPFHTDVQAALDAGDWPLAVEAASLMLKEIGFCRLALAGYVDAPFEADVHMALAAMSDPLLELMSDVAVSFDAAEPAARRAAEIAFEAEAELEGDLPVRIPEMRTPEGFFPTIKLGADLDRLRHLLGIPQDFWRGWIP